MKRTDRLIKVSIGRESDKDSNSCPAQLRKLMGFLEQSISPFAESHHQTVLRFDLLNLDFPSPHSHSINDAILKQENRTES